MKVVDLFKVRNENIKVLHLTMIAFFITFVAWFNMAPLATTMMSEMGWLTKPHVAVLGLLKLARQVWSS